MWQLAAHVMEKYFPQGLSPAGQALFWVVFAVVATAILMGFASTFAGVSSYIERRVAARMMARIGPNRVGPQGIFQFVADGLKLVLKEDLFPAGCDPILFRMAPYLVFAGMFGTFVALPFSARLVAADLDVGILYILSITALVVVGIILGGWSSNSKWSLFGGLRSAAQIVSYEIPAGLSVLVVVLLAGGLSTQAIIEAQGGMPWNWFIFQSPFSFAAFFVFFAAALAEGNRTPFDLPEAESELVAGYSTEYSGFRFVVFFFAEWANLWIMSAVAVLCFFGGWRIPLVTPLATGSTWYWILLGLVIFSVKTLALVFVVIQLRWTLPRLRVDQMMSMCWKYLIPIAFVCILGTMTWILVIGSESAFAVAVRVAMFAGGAGVLAYYFARVRFNYRSDSVNYKNMTGLSMWYPPYRLP